MTTRVLIPLLGLVLLAGCANLPVPTGQLRVTEHGESAGFPLAGSGELGGCIASVVGNLPAGLVLRYAGEHCRVEYQSPRQSEEP